MIKQGVLVRTNGKIEPIEIRNEEDMQAAIGGKVDRISLNGEYNSHGISVFIHDSGRLLEHPINMTICLWLVRKDAYDGLSMPIHGDVLVMGPMDEEGEPTSISNDMIDMIPRFWVEPSNSVVPWDDMFEG